MGLDMYLNRTKRIKGVTVEQMMIIDAYLNWRDDETARKYTLEEWCGVDDEKLPPKELIEYYEESCKNSKSEDVGYWRKANQIHNWFVCNVQDGEDDCGCYEVGKEQLEDLLERCKIVKSNSKLVSGKIQNGYTWVDGHKEVIYADGSYIENPEIAMEYLPTQGGFFFGSTDYDEYYLMDIDDTIQIIEKVLDETDFDTQVIYYSSSW